MKLDNNPSNKTSLSENGKANNATDNHQEKIKRSPVVKKIESDHTFSQRIEERRLEDRSISRTASSLPLAEQDSLRKWFESIEVLDKNGNISASEIDMSSADDIEKLCTAWEEVIFPKLKVQILTTDIENAEYCLVRTVDKKYTTKSAKEYFGDKKIIDDDTVKAGANYFKNAATDPDHTIYPPASMSMNLISDPLKKIYQSNLKTEAIIIPLPSPEVSKAIYTFGKLKRLAKSIHEDRHSATYDRLSRLASETYSQVSRMDTACTSDSASFIERKSNGKFTSTTDFSQAIGQTMPPYKYDELLKKTHSYNEVTFKPRRISPPVYCIDLKKYRGKGVSLMDMQLETIVRPTTVVAKSTRES